MFGKEPELFSMLIPRRTGCILVTWLSSPFSFYGYNRGCTLNIRRCTPLFLKLRPAITLDPGLPTRITCPQSSSLSTFLSCLISHDQPMKKHSHRQSDHHHSYQYPISNSHGLVLLSIFCPPLPVVFSATPPRLAY